MMGNKYKRKVDAVLTEIVVNSSSTITSANGTDINVPAYNSLRVRLSDEYNIILTFEVGRSTLIDVIDTFETCIVNLKHQLTDEEIMSQRRKESV